MTREIEDLDADEILTIAEFGPDQATVREVCLDPAETPRVTSWPMPWPTLMRDGARSVSAEELSDLIRPETPGRLLLAISGADGEDLADIALDQAMRSYPYADAFRLDEPAAGLIRRAIAALPLSQWYELAAVRERADGTLVPAAQPLFPPGALAGDQRSFTFWVEPAEKPGTVFAVLAREDDADPPVYRIAQPLLSAPLAPGRYDVTATLLRRGKVRFDDLPEPLGSEQRSWAEVRASVPPRASRSAPVHLIIALERCGPQELYEQRADCALRLIEKVTYGARALVRYSLVGYGSHSFARMQPESPVEEECWADSLPTVLGALNRLDGYGAQAGGSAQAAKLECALAHIAGRLATDDTAGKDVTGERTVLVAIGHRPPFPPRHQDWVNALPCPQRLDWRGTLDTMASRRGEMAFGAVYGGGEPVPEAWERLGRDARGVPSGFDARQFAISLGLISPVPAAFPLPLIR